MPRVTVPETRLTRAALAVTSGGVAADATSGAMFKALGNEILVLRNQGAGAHVVTIPTPISVDGLAVADLAVTVPAGACVVLGPFPPALYARPAAPDAGFVYANVDGVQTEVVLMLLRFG